MGGVDTFFETVSHSSMMRSGDISSPTGVMWVQAESDRRHHEPPPRRKPRKRRARKEPPALAVYRADGRPAPEASPARHIDLTL